MSETKSDLSPAEWRAKRKLSKASHYKMRRLGRAPTEVRIPGTRIVRITPAADAAWEERMATLAKQEAAKLEQQRRVELASAAGRKAAASELHVSKRAALRDKFGDEL